MHMKPIKKLWEDYDSRLRASKLEMERYGERISNLTDSSIKASSISFSSWLPSFYDELLLYVEQEWKWYAHSSFF